MGYATKDRVESIVGYELDATGEILMEMTDAIVTANFNEILNGFFGEVEPSTRIFQGDGNVEIFTGAVRDVSFIGIEDGDNNMDDVYMFPLESEVKSWFKCGYNTYFDYNEILITGKWGSLGDEVPNEVSALASYLVAKGLSDISQGNLSSRSIEGYSESYRDYDYRKDPSVMTILKAYTVQEYSAL